MNGKEVTLGLCIVVAVMTAGCRKVDLHLVDNLNDNRISVVGHGGMGFQSLTNQLPHNSLSSVIQCIEKHQAEGVEVDVQMSRDGVLFMYHSQYLDQMTDCFSCVHEQLADDLEDCLYRLDLFPNTLTSEHLTTLETVVARFSQRPSPPLMFLDLKTFLPCPTSRPYEVFREMMVKAVTDLIERYQAEDWMAVESKDLVLLQMIRQRNGAVRLFLHDQQVPQNIYTAHENDLFGIVLPRQRITQQQVRLAHDLGLRVTLYNVKSRPGMVNTIQKNPDYIQTDNVPLLQQMLDQP